MIKTNGNPLMTRLNRWKYATAALMSMAISTGAIVPMFVSTPASAQRIYGQSRSVSIPPGVTFPVAYDKDKVVVTPGETVPLTLTVATNIIDSGRNVLVPAGTQIVGQLQPVTRNGKQAVQFVAQELVFASGQRQYINASSPVITRTEKISKGADTGRILTDAAIGAGAASAISLITGDRKIQALEPIGGAAAGAAASVLLRKKQTDVFVLKPEQDLNVTLRSNLVLSRSNY
jgi:hypothetical protein